MSLLGPPKIVKHGTGVILEYLRTWIILWEISQLRSMQLLMSNLHVCWFIGPRHSGWWLTYPSEKCWSSSVGIMKFPIYMESQKIMFQNVPNHRPESCSTYSSVILLALLIFHNYPIWIYCSSVLYIYICRPESKIFHIRWNKLSPNIVPTESPSGTAFSSFSSMDSTGEALAGPGGIGNRFKKTVSPIGNT